MKSTKDTLWLGEIPELWGYTDIGSVYEERNVKVSEGEYIPLSVTMNGIVPQLSKVVKAAEGSDRKLVNKGDFVINSRSDRRGACGVSSQEGTCSTINIVLKPRKGINQKYYSYVLLSERFPDEFFRWGHGIASDLWTTRWREMKKIQLPLPPNDVQERIVEYLDTKCYEIDEMINASHKAINEYKTYRENLIEQAVTKGLNNKASMMFSGDKAFGMIPEHWKMKKIRRIFCIKKEIAGEEGYQVLSITQKGIIPKDISKNEGQMASNYSNYQLVKTGDFAMNHMDLLTGWVDISEYDGVTSPDYRVFCLKNSNNYSADFYLYVMQFCYFKRIFHSLAQGVSEFGRCRLQAEKFLNLGIMCPPYEEQCEIALYLNKKINIIDDLIIKRENYIEKLKEYKRALIFDYTSGKIEI